MGGVKAEARLRKQHKKLLALKKNGVCATVPSLKTLAKKQKAKRDRRKESGLKSDTKRLYIGGLDREVLGETLAKRFDAFGTVSGHVTFPKPKKSDEKFAFLDLDAAAADIQKCMRIYNGSTWKGHQLQVGPCKHSYYRERLEKEWRSAEKAEIVKRQHIKKHAKSAARFMRPFFGNSHLSKRELKRRFPAKSMRKFPFTDYAQLMRGIPSYARFPDTSNEEDELVDERASDPADKLQKEEMKVEEAVPEASTAPPLFFNQGDKQIFSFDQMDTDETNPKEEEAVSAAVDEMDVFSLDLLKDPRKPMFFLWHTEHDTALPDVQRRSTFSFCTICDG